MKISAVVLLTIFSVSSFAVYDQDDRKNLYQVIDPRLQKVASAMAYQVDKHDLRGWTFNRFWKLVMKPFTERGICQSERFSAEQSMRQQCSAVLISSKHLLTAGNCLTDHYCKNDLYYWMFNYDLKVEKPFDYKHHNKNFYRCKKIVKRILDRQTAISFTILELDKEVQGIDPVTVSKNSEIDSQEELVVLGHMAGLPLKIADNARAYDQNEKHFILNSDISGSNLGSAVFNARTYELEGIMIHGTENYAYSNDGCKEAPIYPDNEARELAIKASAIKQIMDFSR